MKRFWDALLLLFLTVFGAAAQTGGKPAATPTTVDYAAQTPSRDQTETAQPMTIAEAINLALKQASAFRAAQINEQIAAQDVRQAKSAFYPRVGIAPNFIFTTPSLGTTTPAGNVSTVAPRPPSFIGANAISEYQGLATVTGELDTRAGCQRAAGRPIKSSTIASELCLGRARRRLRTRG